VIEMMLLVCFDLPRKSKKERKEATVFRKDLITLGFTMKQYSVYERPVKKTETKDNIIKKLQEKIPEKGEIIMYLLTDSVNDSQIAILGEKVFKKSSKVPKMIVL
jgi:CRISPR-associated protein Cas2